MKNQRTTNTQNPKNTEVVSAGAIMGDSAEMSAKKKMTTSRVSISKEKSNVGKLGPKTEAFIPDDLEVMFAAKNSLDLINLQTRSTNALGAYFRDYPEITDDIRDRLLSQTKIFNDNFELAKQQTIKLCEKHPLWKKFAAIKGFTAYQLGILMSCIKDPTKFHTPSALMMYAGLGTYKGLPVNKLNMNKIKEIYHSEGKEFKGFHTTMSGRMEVITDCLMRGQGWFYMFYNRKKLQKIEKAQNEKLQVMKYGDQLYDHKGHPTEKYGPETPVWDAVIKDARGNIIATPTGSICFIATKEARKQSGNVMEVDKEYMWGKKNQSLISFADRAAKKAMKRILLHLIYTEWMALKGKEARNPYPIEYLGHSTMITLEEITNYDSTVKRVKKVKPEEELETA